MSVRSAALSALVGGVATGVVAAGVVVATGVAVPGAAAVQGAAAATPPASSLAAGHTLAPGASLRSPNGAYRATMRHDGRFVITRGTRTLWWSSADGTGARLTLRTSGDLALTRGAHLVWSTATAGSRATLLALGDDGRLTLRSSGGTAWSSATGNGCRGGTGKRVLVSLGAQFARLCSGADQVLATPITSGATAHGDGTPTGTWRLQAKQRDRYLYPSSGGRYYVHYWMPYDGAYGMHDSSWQTFPYGSAKYRTDGSHGCVHFPRAAIAWMYAWAPIGTTVRIRS